MAHLPVLVVVTPLGAALAVALLGLVSHRAARAATLLALGGAHAMALAALLAVLDGGTWRYELAGWPPPWGIEYVVDVLGGGMAVLVSFMALVTAVHAGPGLRKGTGLAPALHQSLHLLLTAGLLGIVLTGDVFNLYVFLEVSALAAYALLAGAGARSTLAVFRYLLIGTTAGALFLLGVGFLYALTGTLNMADLAALLRGSEERAPLAAAVALVMVGLGIKAAVLPLHGWLPDVYAEGPPAVVAFVSSVMGKVVLYALVRLLLFVVPVGPVVQGAFDVLAPVAAVGMLAGAAIAAAQQDVRRMLAWSSVGQTGYIVLGLGLGGPLGLTGAMLHVAAHAVAKGCLFLSASNVMWRAGTTRLGAWTGVAAGQPWTAAAFAVAALSMVGLPPTAGFFSKWYLILAALDRGAWPYVAAIGASSLLSAVYVFRVLETSWLTADGDRARSDAPPAMVAPAIALAVTVLALGVLNQSVAGILAPVFPPGRS